MTKVITRTRAEVYKLWVKALRSGKYKQAQGQLRDEDATESGWRGSSDTFTGFCCLGVLCDLAIKDGGMAPWDMRGGPSSSAGSLQPKVMKWMGMDSYMMNYLIELNDDEEKTFDEIADVIEETIMPAVL